MKNIIIALILVTTPCLVHAHEDSATRLRVESLSCFSAIMAGTLTSVAPKHPVVQVIIFPSTILLGARCIYFAVSDLASSDLLASEIRENETFAQLASVFGEETLFEAIELRTQGASKLKILTHIINNSDYIDFEFLPDPDELKNQAQWKIF